MDINPLLETLKSSAPPYEDATIGSSNPPSLHLLSLPATTTVSSLSASYLIIGHTKHTCAVQCGINDTSSPTTLSLYTTPDEYQCITTITATLDEEHTHRALIIIGTDCGVVLTTPISFAPDLIPCGETQQTLSSPPSNGGGVTSFSHFPPHLYISYESGIVLRLCMSYLSSPLRVEDDDNNKEEKKDAAAITILRPVPTSTPDHPLLSQPLSHPHPSLLSLTTTPTPPSNDNWTLVTFDTSGPTNKQQQPPPTISFHSDEKVFPPVTNDPEGHRNIVSGAHAAFYDSLVVNLSSVRTLLSSSLFPRRRRRRSSPADLLTAHRQSSSASGTDDWQAATVPLSAVRTVTDPPRRMLQCCLCPRGRLLAAADSLGRVLLLDVATRSVVRLWKGVRDARIVFFQEEEEDEGGAEVVGNYLAIHARQRRVVEVHRVRYGGRVAVRGDVGRECVVVGVVDQKGITRCFVTTPSGTLEPLCVHKKTSTVPLTPTRSSAPAALKQQRQRGPSLGGGAPPPSSKLKLQLLRQLVTAETVRPSDDEVFIAFTEIASLDDLSQGLDLLATAVGWTSKEGEDDEEEEEEGRGADFHNECVQYCEKRVEVIEADGGGEGSGGLRILKSNIRFHSRMVDAYNLLHKFEAAGTYSSDSSDSDDEFAAAPRSLWAGESLRWIDTYEKVTQQTCDAAIVTVDEELGFGSFAKCCQRGGETTGGERIVFCDSTRTRREVLVHVFRPLLRDIFVFKIVNSIFECMGMKDDRDKLQQYFGEWFMTLPIKQAAKSSLFSTWCPILRWLQEIILAQLDIELITTPTTPSPGILLLPQLHKFISEADDLPRAFLLAAICHEAITITTKQREAKTYGAITVKMAVAPWTKLLRQLRVCLFLSLRLHKHQPFSSFPLTVQHFLDGDKFSLFQMIAMDELDISNKKDEITALEVACRVSGKGFDLCSSQADEKVKTLTDACCVEARRNMCPLLLFFGAWNDESALACHRILLLGEKWGAEPNKLNHLEDCLATMKGLKTDEKYTKGVILDIWQNRIRPVYRALLYGFEEVTELTQSVVEPLCENRSWLDGLAKVATEILSLLNSSTFSTSITTFPPPANNVTTVSSVSSANSDENEQFPPRGNDIFLSRLESQSHPIQPSSLTLHQCLVQLVQITSSPHHIPFSLPPETTLDPFLQHSLYMETPLASPSTPPSEESLSFVIEALQTKAERTQGPIVSQFDETLFSLLEQTYGIPSSTLRSHYILQMYGLQKDAAIDDLVSTSQQSLNADVFLEGGFTIAAVRLHRTITRLRKVKSFRSFLGVLDADTCQWVKERANLASSSKITIGGEVSLSATHIFILKLMKISMEGNKEGREKAHALSVLSGMILNAMKEVGVKDSQMR